MVCLLGLGLGYESRVVRMSWQYPDNHGPSLSVLGQACCKPLQSILSLDQTIPYQGQCHVGHASVITYNAYYHASAFNAYIQQPCATSTIEHV